LLPFSHTQSPSVLLWALAYDEERMKQTKRIAAMLLICIRDEEERLDKDLHAIDLHAIAKWISTN
jgi:hypothetical protein